MTPNPRSWPKAVLFDLDGTLIDNEYAQYELYKCIADELGAELTREGYERRYRGLTDVQVFEVLCKNAGLSRFHAQECARQKADLYLKNFLDHLQAVPGIHAFLQNIADRALPLAIVTSADFEEAVTALRHLKLLHFFSLIVSIPVLDIQPKPNPDSYLFAANSLAVEPNDCLVYEDSFNGVTAAHSAGMRVIGVQNSDLTAAGASLVIPDYRNHSLPTTKPRLRLP